MTVKVEEWFLKLASIEFFEFSKGSQTLDNSPFWKWPMNPVKTVGFDFNAKYFVLAQ